jgi:hypothetical protein
VIFVLIGMHCGRILMPILKPSKISAYCYVEFEYQISIYPTTEENHKKVLMEMAGRRTILKIGIHLNYTKPLSSYVTENRVC